MQLKSQKEKQKVKKVKFVTKLVYFTLKMENMKKPKNINYNSQILQIKTNKSMIKDKNK